jgi:two-component system, OmpR family, sensor histidine kinase VicK
MVRFILLIILSGGFIVAILMVFFQAKRNKLYGAGQNIKNKAINSSLQNEKLKSDIIVNSIEDGVTLVDSSGNVQLFNPAAAKLTGWEQDETIGLPYKSIVKLTNEKGEPFVDSQDPIQRVFIQKKSFRDNTTMLTNKTGQTVPVDISVSPLLDEEELIGAILIFRDVREQRGEEQRRAEFISTASHEMRTPVAAIEGYLALALNDKVSKIDTKARDYLDKAHASTKHLGKLFQDLLTSAKAEDGRLSSHPKIVEMGDFLEKISDDLRLVAEKKGLAMEYVVGSTTHATKVIDASTFTTDVDGVQKLVKPLYYVSVDPDRIREVITNLFDNAVKYTEAGKISLGLTGDEKVVQLRVTDTGAGIPPQDIGHLFQKFYRVDNSATRTIGGTGLGLFISRKIVELYNGRIWVESELGKGSSFYINLPRLSTETAEKIQTAESSKLPELASNETNNK